MEHQTHQQFCRAYSRRSESAPFLPTARIFTVLPSRVRRWASNIWGITTPRQSGPTPALWQTSPMLNMHQEQTVVTHSASHLRAALLVSNSLIFTLVLYICSIIGRKYTAYTKTWFVLRTVNKKWNIFLIYLNIVLLHWIYTGRGFIFSLVRPKCKFPFRIKSSKI